jgi:hypothetical protein
MKTTTEKCAIYVQGSGWVQGIDKPPHQLAVGRDGPAEFDDLETAYEHANRVADQYERMGLPEMRSKITIVGRTVTATAPDWSEVLKKDGIPA